VTGLEILGLGRARIDWKALARRSLDDIVVPGPEEYTHGHSPDKGGATENSEELKLAPMRFCSTVELHHLRLVQKSAQRKWVRRSYHSLWPDLARSCLMQ